MVSDEFAENNITPKYEILDYVDPMIRDKNEGLLKLGYDSSARNWLPEPLPRPIRALRDFGDVKAGDIGGHVSGYHNLSHAGDCWIYTNAIVIEDGRVEGNAKVSLHSIVRGNGLVADNAVVDYGVIVLGTVRGNATVMGRGVFIDVGRVIHGNERVVQDNKKYAKYPHIY